MSFDALSGVAGLGAQNFGVGGTRGVAASGYLPSVPPADSVQDAGGATFGLTAMQSESKGLAVQALTGDLSDIHNATIASSRAQITLELVAAVRNKGVDAFNEIMRMQA
jgi:flagellar hook-basal body complex protein FliE